MIIHSLGEPTVSYLRPFLPWIVFAAVPGSDWKWAALVALAISIAGIVLQARSGLPPDAQIIEIGSAAYFAALSALAFADPQTALHPYVASLASGALGLIAGVSLAVRKPFTLGIARQGIPREYWDHPTFVRVNTVITAVWTASFLIGCAALAALAHSATPDRLAVQVAAFVVPLAFTLRYAARARARARSAGLAGEPVAGTAFPRADPDGPGDPR
jgi:hypothetical protein